MVPRNGLLGGARSAENRRDDTNEEELEYHEYGQSGPMERGPRSKPEGEQYGYGNQANDLPEMQGCFDQGEFRDGYQHNPCCQESEDHAMNREVVVALAQRSVRRTARRRHDEVGCTYER